MGHTYVATLAAIKHVGLNPVLADISDDYNINVSLIEKLITKIQKQFYQFICTVTLVT